jgi:hypothetical protein
MWRALWEGGTSYIEEMREKIEQQTRYAFQVKLDLDVIPRRIKSQQKTVCFRLDWLHQPAAANAMFRSSTS